MGICLPKKNSESLTSHFYCVIIATPGVDTAGAGGVDGEPLQDVRNVLSHIEDMIETELNKNSSGTSTPVGEAGTPMEVEESKPDVRTQDKTGTQSQLDEEVANLLKLSPSVLHKELIEKCRLALETCIRRFPTHYKSHYRLAYLYMHSPYHQVPVSILCSSISLSIFILVYALLTKKDDTKSCSNVCKSFKDNFLKTNQGLNCYIVIIHRTWVR